MPTSVVDALRTVWPRHTAEFVGRIIGWSPRTVDNHLQRRLVRDEWEALVDLMASNAEFERQVVALSRRRRQMMEDAAPDAERDDLGGPGADRSCGGTGTGAPARRANARPVDVRVPVAGGGGPGTRRAAAVPVALRHAARGRG